MATKKDYYEILGVNKHAGKEEIKKAYKKLAIKHHPDKGGDAEKFKELSEAYAVLSDEEKRGVYDNYGHSGFDSRYSREDIFRGANFDEIFKEAFGGDFFGDDLFSMFFGEQGRRRRRGSDLRYDMEISFEEAAFGAKKKIRIPKLVKCDKCGGTGAEAGSMIVCDNCNGKGQVMKTRDAGFFRFKQVMPCRKCNGHGRLAEKKCRHCDNGVVQENKEIVINIPAGVDAGARLRVNGEGEGIGNGESGDLYVFLHVQGHNIFERGGEDIIVNFPISFSQAALGGNIDVPTLKEKVKIKLPAGTQSNTIFRLRGRGIKRLNREGYGDELVRIIVKTPARLNKKQEELLKELADESREELKIEKGFFEKVKEVFV